MLVRPLSLGIAHRRDRHAEAVQQWGRGGVTAAAHPVRDVGAADKCQHGDRLLCGIDDPVLGDAGLGIVTALHYCVAFHLVGAEEAATGCSHLLCWNWGTPP